MIYKLIMTEGTNELAFINVLISKGLLKFDVSELLAEKPFHARQIDGEIRGYIQLLSNGDIVDIYRIGDKLSDELRIPKSILKEKIREQYKICTLPEFEILFIINENMYDSYNKVKSTMSPSEFYKSNNKNYKKQSEFVTEYFSKMSNGKIIELIDKYVRMRGRTHTDDQCNLKKII